MDNHGEHCGVCGQRPLDSIHTAKKSSTDDQGLQRQSAGVCPKCGRKGESVGKWFECESCNWEWGYDVESPLTAKDDETSYWQVKRLESGWGPLPTRLSKQDLATVQTDGIQLHKTEKAAIRAARKLRCAEIRRLEDEVDSLDERCDVIEREEMKEKS